MYSIQNLWDNKNINSFFYSYYRNCEWKYYLEGNRANYLTEDDNLCLNQVGAGFADFIYHEW